MRYLFIIRSLAALHGSERTITDKANYLAKKGHVVSMLTYEQGNHPIVFKLVDSIQYLDLDCCFFSLRKKKLFKRVLDYIILNNRLKNKLSCFVDVFKPDVVITTSYSRNNMAAIMSIRKKTAVVVESHSVFTSDLTIDTFLKKVQMCVSMHFIRKCDLLITLTRRDATWWKKYVQNVEAIANPLPFYCEKIDFSNRLPNRIICVGRLSPVKRYDRLIEAFSMISDRYPQWYVDIYGDGEERDYLENMIKEKKMANKIVIHAPIKNIVEEYKRSQIFAFCSDFEGFGLVLIEAMACGVPPVSTACNNGPVEIIEDGITGLLSKKDASDFSEKLARLMSDSELRKRIGINAHVSAAKYKMDTIMVEWENAYKSVLKFKK